MVKYQRGGIIITTISTQTIKPDSRGRVSLKPILDIAGWKYGQGVKIDIIEMVDLPPKEGMD